MKCGMITGYKCDAWGDAGDEIYCTNVATHFVEGNMPCCDSCAVWVKREGDLRIVAMFTTPLQAYRYKLSEGTP